jgi:Trk K+ transport system NAD-binding subunit
VVLGLGRYGSRLLGQLQQAGVNAIGVDFDPEAVARLRKRGHPVYFGDAEDPDFVESLPLKHAQVAVVTLPQLESNLALLHALKHAGFAGRITAAVRDTTHGRALLAAGVSDILNPFNDAADRAAEQLARSLAPTGVTP